MGQRLSLQSLLEEILGSRNVYFQPPENIRVDYPCIVYNLSDIDSKHADNLLYRYQKKYTLTLASRDPDTNLVDKLLTLPMCSYDRSFVSDNLNHYVFDIYF